MLSLTSRDAGEEPECYPFYRKLESDWTFASLAISLKDLAQEFRNMLPVLITVEEGFMSWNERDFTLSSDEVGD